jgi:ABC-2 type transport system permease protein
MTMPGFLQKVVGINPISLTAAAVRGAMHGNGTNTEVFLMLLSCAVLIGAFAPITMRLYNNKNTV